MGLLAKAMNSDTKDQVHPSFVEIIKQMSPIDSLVFKTIMERKVNPLIDLVYEKMDEPGFPIATSLQTIATNVSDIDIASVETVCVSIDNLIKQGLISIPRDNAYTNTHVYDNLLTSEHYINEHKKWPDSSDGFKFSHRKKMIEKTNLGISLVLV